MCGFVYFYNIGRTYICSYRCMNVSECAMPWNIGSGSDVAGQGTGQGRWATIPGSSAKAPEGSSCLRLAGRSPATRSSQGEGNAHVLACHWEWNSQEEMAKSTRRNEVRKPWRFHGIWWVALKASQAPPKPHSSASWQKSQLYIHCSILTNTVTHSPALGLNTHWNWTHTEKSTQKITLSLKRAHETRQEVVSYSQPARRYW